jgi:3alpha(or 20beta)-hydroxysteroid dehydrogenase
VLNVPVGVADDIGDSAAFAEHDVTDPDSWRRILRHAVTRFGDPNVLVNNAG